jgi:predicted DCC family thiol-disulfide oxidoreductase YuxK
MIPTVMARDPTACTWLVIYDAGCGFCRWSLSHVLSLDGARRLRPVALGSAEADALLRDLPEAVRAASWHLIAPGGRRWSAGAAAAPLLELLPRAAPLAAVLRRAPRATEATYRWVSAHRAQLGRLIPARARARAERRIARHVVIGSP